MMALAIFDIIPPLPSIWGVLLLLAAFFLYQKKGVAWAAIPGILGGVFMFGWIMSLLGWATSLIITLAVVAVLFFAAKALLGNMRKDKKVKKGTATEHRGSVGAGVADMPDIEALLAQSRETVARANQR